MAKENNGKFALRLSAILGPEICRLVNAGKGWPSMIDIKIDGHWASFAVFFTPVKRHYPNSRPDDYRVQTPGPMARVTPTPGATPLVIGWWGGLSNEVLVGCRVDHWMSKTRPSQMFKKSVLELAPILGWEKYINANDVGYYAFLPVLFPVYAEAVLRGIDLQSLNLSPASLSDAVEASQQSRSDDDLIRARRICTALIRSAAFTKDVNTAYGMRCAMCGLNYGLIEAAHIFPASQSGSQDEVWNGLSLCPNHHQAFDSNLIWVHPKEGTILLHPQLQSQQTPGDRSLTASTSNAISRPESQVHWPRPKMFEKRYEIYSHRLEWLKRKSK